jgi:SAM-dependent methyltransferase
MIPDARYNIWEHTRETLFPLYEARAKGRAAELDAHAQAVDLLAPFYRPGMSVLDAGCGSGYLFWSFYRRNMDVAYSGIDTAPSFIEMARAALSPEFVPAERFRVEAIEETQGRYHAVVCLNTLFCLPDYHQGVERLAGAALEILIIRTTLADQTTIRYETDDYLDDGRRGLGGLRSYFNIWDIREFSAFIERQGFDVQPVVDRRTGDQGEISAGKFFPWRFLFCRRQGV